MLEETKNVEISQEEVLRREQQRARYVAEKETEQKLEWRRLALNNLSVYCLGWLLKNPDMIDIRDVDLSEAMIYVVPNEEGKVDEVSPAQVLYSMAEALNGDYYNYKPTLDIFTVLRAKFYAQLEGDDVLYITTLLQQINEILNNKEVI